MLSQHCNKPWPSWPTEMYGIFFKWILAHCRRLAYKQTQAPQPRCPLIHCSNWELLAQKTTHNQTKGGLRPLSQLCPLSLMSLNDFNILPCHNLANRCQFNVTTRPIGYLPQLWPRGNDDVQFNISVNLYSKESKSENEGGGNVSELISWSTSGNRCWRFTY